MMTCKNTFLPALLAGAVLLISGCVVGPDYRRPALPSGAAYSGAENIAAKISSAPAMDTGATAGTSAAQVFQPGMDIPAQWWELFGSKDLEALVAEVLRKNPTLDAAKAALKVVHESARAQAGAYYPTVGVGIEPTRQRIANTLASPASSGDSIYTLTTTQVGVSFTPDLFGANHRAVESLVALEKAQGYELEAARLTLAANVVSAAILDAQLRAQIDAADAVVANQLEICKSFERQAALGQASQLDLAAQETSLAQAEAAIPPLQKQLDINLDLLSSLLGRTPGEALPYRFTLEALTLPGNLPLSLPARLVEQRPDVLIAEAQLRAANAQIGVAAAARLPNVTITAAGGNAAVFAADLFTGPTTYWSLAASLTQPIFDGGTLRHRQRAAEAGYALSAAQYRSTVIAAFQNVSDVLHATQSDTAALLAAQRSEQAAGRTLDLAKHQLQLGDISRLAMLGAEQAYAQAKSGLVQAQANRFTDTAALFQALGGGWWNRKDERSDTAL
jgi:NodT family efflux transporter outer membrane factor (OMF) lipoprotein